MQTSNPIRILYVGDSWLTAGTLGAYSSLAYDLRGASVENQVQQIVETWRANPAFSVEYMAGWDALARFPETTEAIHGFDVIFLSDVESDSIILYPPNRSARAPMGSNRHKLIREYVREGGALAMIGGYASFTGQHNAGNYRGTAVEEVLPVTCLAWNDDRVETPEGVSPVVDAPDHSVVRGLAWDDCPVFNGYNKIEAKIGARVLAHFRETGDPMLVAWEFGAGRSLAFASDVAPHWGAEFQQWKDCARFLEQAVRWLTRRELQ